MNGSLLFLRLRALHGVCALSNGYNEHEHELEANPESEDKPASNPRIAEPGAVMRLQLPRSFTALLLPYERRDINGAVSRSVHVLIMACQNTSLVA